MAKQKKRNFIYYIALFISTSGFTGYFPIAPGTVGTAVAAAFYLLLTYLLGPELYWVLLTLIASIVLGVWSAGVVERVEGKKDPGKINIDEFAGFFISILLLPYNWVWAIIVFFLFRFFDIVKPYPIRKLEGMGGGTGIMVDDLAAGVYSLIAAHIIHIVACNFDIPWLYFLR